MTDMANHQQDQAPGAAELLGVNKTLPTKRVCKQPVTSGKPWGTPAERVQNKTGVAPTLLSQPRRDWLFVTCEQHGHDWEQDGGRPCPLVDQETPCPARNLFCGNPGMPSQPVFRCTRCPAIDYGESGGPGAQHCQDYCMPRAA